jgi:hypothetical protein
MKYLLFFIFISSSFAYDESRLNTELNFAIKEMKKKEININTQIKRFKRTRLLKEIPADDKIYDLDKTFNQLGEVSKNKKRKFKRTRKKKIDTLKQ